MLAFTVTIVKRTDDLAGFRVIPRRWVVERTLEEVADWFAAEGVTAVAMEATGSYWKPVWYVLEERLFEQLLLVNAHRVKILPGRKSDVLDAEWLAELLQHRLLRAASCRRGRSASCGI